jgi:hypothetical protein
MHIHFITNTKGIGVQDRALHIVSKHRKSIVHTSINYSNLKGLVHATRSDGPHSQVNRFETCSLKDWGLTQRRMSRIFYTFDKSQTLRVRLGG